MNYNDEYEKFVDKFKPKLTTDDCYTPQEVYDVIAQWVAEEYRLDPNTFCRPFYPGGDYESYNYTGSVVVDNPPFSFLSQIVSFFCKRNILFFLFAPALTVFQTLRANDATAICVNAKIIYHNGAEILTNFVTNLDENRIRTAPELRRKIDAAQNTNNKAVLPRYVYPNYVISAASVNAMANNGIFFKVKKNEAYFIASLDDQKRLGKTIFGSGFLVSERAAAERAAADNTITWNLSPREKKIIFDLSNGGIEHEEPEQMSFEDYIGKDKSNE